MAQSIIIDVIANDKASPQIKNLNKELGGMEAAAGLSTGAMLALGTTILTTAAAVGKMALEYGALGAANERLTNSGQALAVSYGSSLDTIVSKVKAASLNTVSEMDIIASSNKAMMLGVGGSAEQLANLMEIAALRGRAMGISTTQAFDDMARGIGRMSPMILDNLGIIVDAKTTYAAYAENIGKSASELTRSEKIQALLNKVLSEGNKLLDKQGGLVADNVTEFERFNAELENSKALLYENFLGMSRWASMGADMLVVLQDLGDNGFGYGNEKLNLFSMLTEFATARVARMREEAWAAADAVAAHGDALGNYSIEAQAATDATLEDTEALEAHDKIMQGVLKNAMWLTDEQKDYNEALTELNEERDNEIAKLEILKKKYGEQNTKVQEQKDKIVELDDKIRTLQETQQEQTNQWILNMLAQQGATAEMQLEFAKSVGLIDENSADMVIALMEINDQIIAGGELTKEYKDQIRMLGNRIMDLDGMQAWADIWINVHGDVPDISTVYGPGGGATGKHHVGSGTAGTEIDGTDADGGPVEAGKRYLVGERGMEVFVPNQNGAIIPNHKLGQGGGDVVVNLTYAPIISGYDRNEVTEKLLPFIREGLRQVRLGA